MTYLKVNLAFLEETNPSVKLTFGQDRQTDMSAAPVFTSPLPDMITIGSMSSTLSDGINAANGGNPAQKDALKNIIKNWNAMFRKLAMYVETIANEAASLGDAIDIVNASGFKYNKLDKSPAVAPAQPLINGRQLAQAGQVEIIGKKPAGTVNMLTIVSTIGNSNIQVINNQLKFSDATALRIINHTKGKIKIIDLESTVRYYIQRIAFNTAGPSAVSPPIAIVAP